MSELDPKIRAKLRQLERELQSQSTTAPPVADRQIGDRFAIPLYFLAIAWGQQVIDQVVFAGRWNLPIIPRRMIGVPGVILSIFSHADFAHLAANSIPFVIFSWLILIQSYRDYWITLLVGWLGGGFLCWLLGPSPVHGLSGVVYTLFGYLLWIGWQERRVIPLAISVFVLVNYGRFLWGVLPQDPRVAWWGHLIGFMLGIGTAYLLGKHQQNSAAK
jgi:membrane associated rhomboid family serine protease